MEALRIRLSRQLRKSGASNFGAQIARLVISSLALPRAIVAGCIPHWNFLFDACRAEAPVTLAVTSKDERQPTIGALDKLPPAADYSQQLESDDLKHARDREHRLEPTWPCLSLNDVFVIHVRHEGHCGKFQPSRDAPEQTLELILRTRAAVSKSDRVLSDGFGVA